MTRSPLTWQNVAAPDFRGTAELFKSAREGFSQTGESLIGLLDTTEKKYKDEAALQFEKALLQRQDSEQLQRDLSSGAVLDGIDKRFLGVEALKRGNAAVNELTAREQARVGIQKDNVGLEQATLNLSEAQKKIAEKDRFDQWSKQNPEVFTNLYSAMANGDWQAMAGILGGMDPQNRIHVEKQFNPKSALEGSQALEAKSKIGDEAFQKTFKSALANAYNFKGTIGEFENNLVKIFEPYLNNPLTAMDAQIEMAKLRKYGESGGSLASPIYPESQRAYYEKANNSSSGSVSSNVQSKGKFSFDKDRQDVAGVLLSSGLPPPVVAGFLGNFEIEGGYGGAEGDKKTGKPAAGIAQWRDARRENFKSVMGKDPLEATKQEQAEYVMWELANPTHPSVSMTTEQVKDIMSSTTPADAAAKIDRYFERSNQKSTDARAAAANTAATHIAFEPSKKDEAVKTNDAASKASEQLASAVTPTPAVAAEQLSKSVPTTNDRIVAPSSEPEGTVSPSNTWPGAATKGKGSIYDPNRDRLAFNSEKFYEGMRRAFPSTAAVMRGSQEDIAKAEQTGKGSPTALKIRAGLAYLPAAVADVANANIQLGTDPKFNNLIVSGKNKTSNFFETLFTGGVSDTPTKSNAAKVNATATAEKPTNNTGISFESEAAKANNIDNVTGQDLLGLAKTTIAGRAGNRLDQLNNPAYAILSRRGKEGDPAEELKTKAGKDVTYAQSRQVIDNLDQSIKGFSDLSGAQKAYILSQSISPEGILDFKNVLGSSKINIDRIKELTAQANSPAIKREFDILKQGNDASTAMENTMIKELEEATTAYETEYKKYGPDNRSQKFIAAEARYNEASAKFKKFYQQNAKK